MTTFKRSGHWRTTASGSTVWVSACKVTRVDWNCDWGGYNHGGGDNEHYVCGISVPQTISVSSPFSFYKSIERYVDPNALCPVCGASVYYYQNEFGSRVFFDELRPPWPKHPCTDNPYIYILDELVTVGHPDFLVSRDTKNQKVKNLIEKANLHPIKIVKILAGHSFLHYTATLYETSPQILASGKIEETRIFFSLLKSEQNLIKVSAKDFTYIIEKSSKKYLSAFILKDMMDVDLEIRYYTDDKKSYRTFAKNDIEKKSKKKKRKKKK